MSAARKHELAKQWSMQCVAAVPAKKSLMVWLTLFGKTAFRRGIEVTDMSEYGRKVGELANKIMANPAVGAEDAFAEAFRAAGGPPTPEDALAKKFVMAAPWVAWSCIPTTPETA